MAYTLKIAGSTVPLGEPAEPGERSVVLDALEVRYDEPAALTFRSVGPFNQALFAADAIVELLEGSSRRFLGRLDLPGAGAAAGGGQAVSYVAYDYSRQAAIRPAKSATGLTAFFLDGGTLSAVVAQFLLAVAPTLTEIGISATPNFAAGAGDVQTLPIAIEGGTIHDAVLRIARAAPGVRVRLDMSGTPRYTFVNIFGTDPEDLVLDDTRVESINLRLSLEGRSGAVRVTQREAGGTSNEEIQTGVLSPAWNTSLESQWTIDHAAARNADGTVPALALVFRKWSFAGFSGQVEQRAEVAVLVDVSGDFSNAAQVEVQSIDWDAKTLTLAHPAIKPKKPVKAANFNPQVPGKAQRASAKLLYTRVEPQSPLPGLRYPEFGFAGTVYALAPTTTGYEQQVDLPAGVDPRVYARQAWAVLSEPAIEGSVTTRGPVPDSYYGLDRRLNVSTRSGIRTAMEGLRAPLMGFRLNFDAGQTVELDFSTDRSALLREGLG